MRKLRNIVLVSGGAVLLTVAILIAVIQWFNWDRYRDDTARWIESVTARPVSIDGPIEVKILPFPRIHLAGISIGNPEGNFTGQFFHVESAYARLNPTALFVGKLVLEELRLDRPRVQFEVDSAGNSNWRISESVLNRLQSKTPAVIPRQLWITGGQLQFTNSHSNQIERVEIQDFFLGVSEDRTIPRIEALAHIHGVPIDMRGTLGDMDLWREGNIEAILLQYMAGDIEGELSGEITEIFDKGQVDLHLSARGDQFNTAGQLLDLAFDLGATPFLFNAKLQGNWQDISLTDMVATITGQGFQIDMAGEARDLFRHNNLDLDLSVRTDALNDLMTTLGQSPLIEGTADMRAHLFGQLRGNLELKDVEIKLQTTVGVAKAEGVARGLNTAARFENLAVEMQFEAHTEHLHDFLAAFDQNMPIDGIGTAKGQLIRSGDRYRVEDLSLTADSPELSLSATGTVDSLGDLPEFTLQITGRSVDLAQLSQVWSWGWTFPVGVELAATGSLKAVAGTVATSNLALTIMGQEVVGHFSGRLPSMGYTGRPDWSLDLNFDDLGSLLTGLGVPWVYAESGQFTLRSRPSGTNTKSFHVQTGLNTEELEVKVTGEVTGFNARAGFELAYSIVSPGAPDGTEWFGVAISRIGSFQVEGSAKRIVGDGQSVTGMARLVAEQLGSVVVEGEFGSSPRVDSEFRLTMESDSIAEVAALGSFTLAGVGPFRGDAIIHLMPERILLEGVHLRAGDNDLHGSIVYRSAVDHGGRAEIDGQLWSSYLNVNELLPPPERQFLFSAEPLPVRWAETHDVDVGFEVGRLLRRNYDLRDLTGRVNSNNGEVDGYSNSSAFGGDLELHLMLDTRSTPYRAVYQYDWKGLNLALLPAARKVDREITGRVNLKGGITGAGNSLHQIMERGDGYLLVDLENARLLRGEMELLTTSPINIAEQILRDVSPWVQRKKFFDIECGVIGMQIENGIGRSLVPPDHTIAIKAKEFRLVGFGDVQLTDESIGLSVRSKARRLGLSAAELIEQSGLSPIYSPFYRIAGTLLRPKVEPDPQGTDLLQRLKLTTAWATGGTSVFLLSLIDRLVVEPVGCEGARERAHALVPVSFP